MIVGNVSLIYHKSKIVAIRCSKGRGTILPGGKWNKGETFKECAARELREEAGLIASYQTFIYGGMSTDGAFVNTFLTDIISFDPVDSEEGEVVLATWQDLYQSEFRAYYEILRDVMIHRQEEL